MLLACITTTSASPSTLMAMGDVHESSASYMTVRFAGPSTLA